MGRRTVRHSAQYSKEVVALLRDVVLPEVEGPVHDPFAGLGLQLDKMGRDDITGTDLEPEWAACSPLVQQGDALDPDSYPPGLRAVVTSPVYGNRLGDPYRGPRCKPCKGTGGSANDCDRCDGSGYDGTGRYGYAVDLGRLPSDGSSCLLQFENGPKGAQYRVFHQGWLHLIAGLLPPGEKRLVVNVSDHYRTTVVAGEKRQRRQHAVAWWLAAAHRARFMLAAAHHVDTRRIGHGSNQQAKVDGEMVLVFDLITNTERAGQ